MLPVLLAILAWLPALVGLGSILRHDGDAELRPAIAGLLGVGVLGAFVTALNFATPVTTPVAAALWVAGAALAVARRRWILEGARTGDLILTLAAAALVVRFAWPASKITYDTGLYHLQTVQWFREHATQLGLGNLHDRLAYNSVWHAAAAALEVPGAAGRSVWFANAIPIVFSASAGVTATRKLLSGDASFPTVFLAGVLLLATAALPSVPGLGTDFVAALLAYVAIACWARALDETPWPGRDAEAATLLALFATLMKVSTGMILAASVLLLAVRWRTFDGRALRRIAVVSAAALLPWMTRFVATTGCLVFPAPATCVSFLPWSMTPAAQRWSNEWIRSWARKPFAEPAEVFSSWDWIRGWPALYATPDHVFLLQVLAVGLVAWLVVVRETTRAFGVTLAIACVGTAFWFFTAPAPRFGYGYLYPLALLPISFALSRAARRVRPHLARPALAAALAAGMVALFVTTSTRAFTRRAAFPLSSWPTEAFPVADTEQSTRFGLVVRKPSSGDQCWETPIPCAPTVDPDLAWTGNRFVVRHRDLAGRPSGASRP